VLTTAAYGASALDAAWVVVAVSVTASACDSDADSCYGVTSAGVGVPWQLITVLVAAFCVALVVLSVRTWRGLAEDSATRRLLVGPCAVGAVVAAWGYDPGTSIWVAALLTRLYSRRARSSNLQIREYRMHDWGIGASWFDARREAVSS
jgi:hypothetical protein